MGRLVKAQADSRQMVLARSGRPRTDGRSMPPSVKTDGPGAEKTGQIQNYSASSTVWHGIAVQNAVQNADTPP